MSTTSTGTSSTGGTDRPAGTVVSAGRVAALVEGFARSPAYLGLAEALAALIVEGRIARDVRLPSERDLCGVLGVSRTTVTNAYARMVEGGYARTRRGAGTFTDLPEGARRSSDAFLTPSAEIASIDLTCAAGPAAPGVAAAYALAQHDLPAHLAGHGYFPAGLPQLRAMLAERYTRQGLPTVAEQIVVTPGALAAANLAVRAFGVRGDRVLVENPTYPNAVQALRRDGVRIQATSVDSSGWDLDQTLADLRRTRPALAYLMPDFHNPTGHLMGEEDRARYAAALRAAGTVAIIDESHREPLLSGDRLPGRFAEHAPGAITLGSASKRWWGGLRLGWIRLPSPADVEALLRARLSGDLGTPVLEQLVLFHLLSAESEGRGHEREVAAARRERRDALAAAVRERLPEWSFRVPDGGLTLWCRLPRGRSSLLATACAEAGVVLAPGPVFAVHGGLDSQVRIPWVLPTSTLVEAVDRIADCWHQVGDRETSYPEEPRPHPAVVA